MAIDVFSENVITLREACKLLPKCQRNKKISLCTVYRWYLSGLRSKDGMLVKLEVVKVGGTACTSKEALQRFFDRLSGNQQVVTPPTQHQKERQRQIEAAEEYLRRMGI